MQNFQKNLGDIAVSQLLFCLNCRETRNMNTSRNLENLLSTRRFVPAFPLYSNSPKTFFLTEILSHDTKVHRSLAFLQLFT